MVCDLNAVRRIIAISLLILASLSISCDGTLTVKVPSDFKWHSVYSVQIPNVNLEIEVQRIADTSKQGCRENREPSTVQIRIVQLHEFPDYDKLPEKAEESPPDPGGVPLAFRDSGPLDLTGVGARRLVPLITGKEILVRSKDPCAVLKVRLSKPKRKS